MLGLADVALAAVRTSPVLARRIVLALQDEVPSVREAANKCTADSI